jgi:hypothetical protein
MIYSSVCRVFVRKLSKFQTTMGTHSQSGYSNKWGSDSIPNRLFTAFAANVLPTRACAIRYPSAGDRRTP